MEESSFPLKPVAGVLILIAALGGGIYWFFTLPVPFTGPEGYEVSVPHGWEIKPHEGGMTAGGLVDEKHYGSASVSFHPTAGGGRPMWPEAALYLVGIRTEWHKTDTIDGRPAVVMTYKDGSTAHLAAVVDRGDGLIFFRIGCPPEVFEPNRSLFERMARRIVCGKP